MSIRIGLPLALAFWLGGLTTAHAGGNYYAGTGAKGLARGGAVLAGVRDPLALHYNPAKLADLPGTQVLFDLNATFYKACVDRSATRDQAIVPAGQENLAGTYLENAKENTSDTSDFGVIPEGRPSNSWAGAQFPEVCNTTEFLPIPAFSVSHSLDLGFGRLGLAFGLTGPGAVAGKTRWGNRNGTIAAGDARPDVVCDPATQDCSQYCDPEVSNTCDTQFFCDPTKYDCDRLPSPTRYQIISQEGFGLPFNLAMGLRVHETLAIGVQLSAFTFLTAKVQGMGALTNEQPGIDTFSELTLKDNFVPSALGSVQYTPIPGLDLAGYFQWRGDLEADVGARMTARHFNDPTEDQVEEVKAGDGIVATLPQQWDWGIGARYAMRRGTGDGSDPMKDEVFDVEFDFIYEMNARVKGVSVSVTEELENRDDVSIIVPFVKGLDVPRGWRDQKVFRLGGSYNVLPNLLSLHAGVNYETRGVLVSQTAADTMPIPAQRVGLHAGLTYRIGDWDLSAAYGHIFQSTITVLPQAPPGTSVANAAERRIAGPIAEAPIMNAGTYRSRLNLASVGVTVHY